MPGDNNNRPIIEPLPAAAAAADVKKLTMKGLKLELDDLAEMIEDTILNEMVRLVDAVNELKDAQTTLSSNQAILQEGLYVLSDLSMKANPPAPAPQLVTLEAPEPEPELIPEPEPEPEPIQFETPQHAVLKSIADSCIVMNDILLLCKAMKKVPELDDPSRIALLDLAGRRAGIEIQPGMQVRAGVKMIVA